MQQNARPVDAVLQEAGQLTLDSVARQIADTGTEIKTWSAKSKPRKETLFSAKQRLTQSMEEQLPRKRSRRRSRLRRASPGGAYLCPRTTGQCHA